MGIYLARGSIPKLIRFCLSEDKMPATGRQVICQTICPRHVGSELISSKQSITGLWTGRQSVERRERSIFIPSLVSSLHSFRFVSKSSVHSFIAVPRPHRHRKPMNSPRQHSPPQTRRDSRSCGLNQRPYRDILARLLLGIDNLAMIDNDRVPRRPLSGRPANAAREFGFGVGQEQL